MLQADGLPADVFEALSKHEIDLQTLSTKVTANHLNMLGLKISHLIQLEAWLSAHKVKQEAERLKTSQSNFNSCAVANWPVINVFAEVFGALGRDAISDYETFGSFVRVIALLGGLTLSVSVGLTTAVSYDELTSFEERAHDQE
jgi:hypothetical protein